MSDVHGRVEAVEALRRREARSRFDVVVVAGDIEGNGRTAAEVLAPLFGFGCPVAFVHGNWDRRLPYGETSGAVRAGAWHLHGRPLVVDGRAFVGFSGCRGGWGMNPVAVRMGTADEGAVVRENLREAVSAWAKLGIGEERTALVTHDRCPRAKQAFPGLRLHLFGHRHGFRRVETGGTTFVNVSAMDAGAEAGSYAVLRWDRDGAPAVERRELGTLSPGRG
ncbi:MAG: metallophosphoesterase family protein [Gluconacetobacter diazotrophicus]|nr:metallophosphoesterase family protein [Gluconacetobacter diazotrophicus]